MLHEMMLIILRAQAALFTVRRYLTIWHVTIGFTTINPCLQALPGLMVRLKSIL